MALKGKQNKIYKTLYLLYYMQTYKHISKSLHLYRKVKVNNESKSIYRDFKYYNLANWAFSFCISAITDLIKSSDCSMTWFQSAYGNTDPVKYKFAYLLI